MCAANYLSDGAFGANHFSQRSNKLCSRGAIAKDYNILVFELGLVLPSCAVEDLAIERLYSRNFWDHWLIECTDSADQSSTFSDECFVGLVITEVADPDIFLRVPPRIYEFAVETSAAMNIVSIGNRKDVC
jgi:hypothetical protein